LSAPTGYLKLEYRRWKPSPAFLILAAYKLLGMRFPSTLLVPAVASVDLVDPLAQPPVLAAALEAPIRACREQRFQLCFYYTAPTIGAVVSLAAALVSEDQLTAGAAMAAQARNGLKQEVHLGLVSRLRGGRFLGTSDGRSLFDPAPEIDPLVLRGRPFPELLQAHAGRVKTRGGAVLPVGDVRELLQETEQVQTRANWSRGIYVTASPEDVARMTRLYGGPGGHAAGGGAGNSWLGS
jgi:hypothetical protein